MSDKRYELPDGWIWTTIEKICTKPQYGWTTSANFNESGIKLLRTTDISSGSVDWNKVPFCTKEPDVPEKYLLHKGDILVSRAGSVGISFQIENCPKAIFASYLIRFKPVSPIQPRFISLYFKSSYYWTSIADNTAGIAIPNVNASKLKQLDIPLPPLNERKRIVKKIENLLDRLNKTKQELAKIPPLLKKIRQSVLAKAFSGELTKEWREQQKNLEPAAVLLSRIRNERKKQLGKKYKESEPIDTSSLWELPEGWEWVRLEFLFEWSNGESLTKKKMKEGDYHVYGGNGITGMHNDFLCEIESLVVGRVGANCGNVHIAPPKSWITDNAIYSSWHSGFLNMKFIHYLLSNINLNSFSGGTGQPYVSQTILNTITIGLPPLLEQQVIVNKIEILFSQAEATGKSVKIAQGHCKKLTQSILAKAFRGELVEQDPNDEPAEKSLSKIKACKCNKK